MIKLFTHTDLDGVGCAILAKLAFGDNVSITYCNSPSELEANVNSLIMPDYEKCYITDLSVSSDYNNINFLATYKNLILFDHHKTAEWLNDYDFANVHVEYKNKLTCGTELFHNYLVKHNLISPRPFFVEQVRLYDTWDWSKSNNDTPKYLNDLLYIRGISEFVDTYVARLKRHDISALTIFNGNDLMMLAYEQKQIDNYVNKKCASAVEITFANHKCMLSFADRYQSVLGNKLCTIKDDIDMAMIVNVDDGIVSLRSIGETDVSGIAKQYGGGGHKNSSGFVINNLNKTKLLIKLLE